MIISVYCIVAIAIKMGNFGEKYLIIVSSKKSGHLGPITINRVQINRKSD